MILAENINEDIMLYYISSILVQQYKQLLQLRKNITMNAI
jgi:hypothetical protein